MAGALGRYQKLGLQESFYRINHYPLACRELALILKFSYSKFPKTLQSIVFQDVLTAFRLLPRMQTQTAITAANNLIHVVESTLPKQKKTLAVTEFKHAMVACKRFLKARYSEQDLVELPQDVLVHVFSFLDLQSLVFASQVSRSWNVASNDSHIWQLMYDQFFNSLHNFSKIKPHAKKSQHSIDNIVGSSSHYWKTTFKKAYKAAGISSKKLESSRSLCKHCHLIVWVSDMANETSKLNCKYHQIRPITTRQIVEYIDGEYASSDSDSDSDSYDEFTSKLWAYPRRSESFV